MIGITQFLNDQPAWHWWALGAILLTIEIASTTQYLLWPGLAALVIGALKYFVPSLDGRLAVFLFAIVSVVATALWKRSSLGKAERTTHTNLNERSAQYVGRIVKAEDNFVNGRGAVRVDDTRWNAVVADNSAPMKGDLLKISAADGAEFKVAKAPAPSPETKIDG